ncbi:MAG TPA: tripartite tricarboxylate transporter substrate-binding protein [Beijerinckiaceae bacterium]|nr:tripartite tricarboxylate transporter substrate-binding protein [Beijerinckiaceae bacterium]
MSLHDTHSTTRLSGVLGLPLALGAALALSWAAAAGAQAASNYPNKPVHIVVPYGPGGVADVELRIIAQGLTDVTKQQFLIDNRPGAGGVVAGTTVLNAAPDGYTLLMVGNNNSIGEALFKSMPFHAATSFTPISALAGFEFLIVSKYGSPLKTVKALIAAAKAHPGKLNFGTITTGSTSNLAADLFESQAGIKAAVVPYRTTPTLISALVRGDVDVAFDTYTGLKGAMAGKLVSPIATTGRVRSPVLPKVPTVVEGGLTNYVVTSSNALSAPLHTPPAVIAYLNAKVRQALALPQVRAKLLRLGMTPKASSPAAVTQRLNHDYKTWSAVIKKAGIKRQ